MSTVAFNDGDGVKRYTDVVGTGTTGDPFVFIFRFPDGYTVPIAFDASTALRIRDGAAAGNTLAIDSTGVITAKFTSETAAANPTATSGIIGLIRGLWTSLVQLGTSTDTSSSLGSIHAKLRFLIADTLGTTTDAADGDGTFMARSRLQSRAFRTSNVLLRFGTSAVDTISGTPAWFLGGFVYNKSTSIRYLQIFDRTTNPVSGTTVPNISLPLAPSSINSYAPEIFGGQNGFLCSAGLAWGFSTTEAIFTAGAPADVSVNLFWRSN